MHPTQWLQHVHRYVMIWCKFQGSNAALNSQTSTTGLPQRLAKYYLGGRQLNINKPLKKVLGVVDIGLLAIYGAWRVTAVDL